MTKTFDKKKHEYKIDGKLATGVTSVISVLAKPQLIGWAARMAAEYIDQNSQKMFHTDGRAGWFVTEEDLESAKIAHARKKEAAGTHGTDKHSNVEIWIGICISENEGKPIGVEETIKSFCEWAHENVDHFLFAERQMFNKELFIAGTADFAYIGKDGKKYMADFKTSSGMYGIDYWLQTAAYRMLAEGEGDEPYNGCVVVRLGKDGSFEVNYLYDYDTYKEAFLCCLKLYRAQAAIKDVLVKGE